MYILTITYPASEGATFDFDYFRTTHLPEIGRAFGPFGLGYASVLRGEEAVGGGQPAVFATAILSFSNDIAARNAVASSAGQALIADTAKFTSATPVLQFNSAVQ